MLPSSKVGDKSVQEQFREQAGLIDRLFILRFSEWDKKWEAKFDRRVAEWDAKFDAKLAPVWAELAAMRADIRTILSKLP